MKQTFKKVCSLLLVALMVVGILPTFALAEGEKGVEKGVKDYLTIDNKPVAVGDAYVKGEYPIDLYIGDELVASDTFNAGKGTDNKLTLSINEEYADTLMFENEDAVSISKNVNLARNKKVSDDKLQFSLKFNEVREDARFIVKLTAIPSEGGSEGGEVAPQPTPEPEQGTLTLKYDLRGGIAPEGFQTEVTGLKKNTKYPLSDAKPTHMTVDDYRHPGQKVDVLFVGWSLVPLTIHEYGMPMATVEEVQMFLTDKTVYAVYSYDRNEDGLPDYNQDLVMLSYDNKGGIGGPGTQYYLRNKVVNLNENGVPHPTHKSINGNEVEFAGWVDKERFSWRVLGKDEAFEFNNEIQMTCEQQVNAVYRYVDKAEGDTEGQEEEKGLTLTYDLGGGIAPEGFQTKVTGLEKFSDYELSKAVPTHAAVDDYRHPGQKVNVVFAGWTETPLAIHEYGMPMVTVDKVKMLATDRTVYAAYSYDRNNDGKPDYNQDLVMLIYDNKGGSGGPGVQYYLRNELVDLNEKGVPHPTHPTVNNKEVVFEGWVDKERFSWHVLEEDEEFTCDNEIRMTCEQQVNAVYRYKSESSGGDQGGETNPDANTFTLTYDANGGTDSRYPMTVNGIKKGLYELSKEGPKHADVKDPLHPTKTTKVAFIGWKTVPGELILEKISLNPCVNKIDIQSNRTVYAVYGYDRNGNDVPDLLEAKLEFEVETGIEGSGPDTYYGKIGETVKLADFKPLPEHENAKDGTPIIFAGWVESHAKANHNDSNVFGRFDKFDTTLFMTEKTLNDPDCDVHAVYSYDRDRDGKPDILEPLSVTLTYDANGGTGAPAAETRNVKDDKSGLAIFELSKQLPTREGHVFSGYSTTPDGEPRFYPGTKSGTIGIDHDTTIYATWDKEITYKLHFDANGGKNAPADMSAKSIKGYADFTIPKTVPTNGDKVLVGWNTDPNAKHGIASPGGVFRAYNENTTLYAIWANKGDIPKTGDDSNLGIWAALLSISAISAGAAITIFKKHGKQ